ncbi:MAG: tyrosine-type recombinase/integrase [Acidobacteriota bacterium]|jgi:integrase
MAVYKQDGSSNWSYKFMWHGQSIRRSTKQTNRRVAEQMEAAHKTQLAKGEVGIAERKPTTTLAAFATKEFLPFVETTSAEKPRTVAFYRGTTANLLKFKKLASLPIDGITGDLIAEYVSQRQQTKAQTSTINRELATLRRMFSLCSEWNRTDKRLPKVRLMAGENQRDRVLSLAEEAAYLEAANRIAAQLDEDYAAALDGIRATMRGQQPRKPDSFLLRDVVLLLLDCGLRPEEVYRLKWEQVQNGVVQIMTGKTRNAKRRIPMSQRAAAALEMRRSWVESEWVFPADAECGHIGPSTLKKQHAKALRLSSVNPFVFYILRHTCLSRWAGGLDPFLLKSLAGHGSIVTTQRYIHVSDEQSFAALEKVRGGHSIGHTANMDQNERPAEAGLLN